MRVARRLVQEQILHHHALHRRETRGHVLGVGIGLQNILALNIDALVGSIDRRVDHVGDAQSRFGLQLDAPGLLEQSAAPLRSDTWR